jgi:hypothetical protein
MQFVVSSTLELKRQVADDIIIELAERLGKFKRKGVEVD